MSSTDAEAKAEEFIQRSHTKVERVFFAKRYPEENFWVLKGEVKFKRAHFFATTKIFEAQIDMNTGQVKAYAEKLLKKQNHQG